MSADPHDEIRELISRTALSDRTAFAMLYDRTAAKLFGVALRILGNRHDTEDAVQEIYIKVWQRAASFEATGASPMSWLIAIARNHAIDRLRSRRVAHEDVSGNETPRSLPVSFIVDTLRAAINWFHPRYPVENEIHCCQRG